MVAHKTAKGKKSRGHHREDRHAPRGRRPLWSGSISFGLVTVPIQMFPATRRRSVALRMLTPRGNPVQRRYYCPEDNREVHSEHLLRGYELEDGQYVVVTDEELDAVAAEKSKEIDLRRFVKLDDLPADLFEKAYYLTPTGNSSKAYRLLAEVMEQTGRVGIATFVMRDREHLVAIIAERGILRAETLRFQDEVRPPEVIGLPELPKRDKQRIKHFERLIKQHHEAAFDRSELHDEYAEQLMAIVNEKRKSGRDVVQVEDYAAEEDDEEGADTDLLETIRSSLRGANGAASDGNGQDKQDEHLEEQSKLELYQQAQERDIPGRSKMTKQELIQALRE